VHDLGSVENEFPAIVFNDALKPEVTLSCEPACFRTWLGISLETTMMSTMDLDGVTCLTAIEEKRDTAYQRQVFTRKRVFTIPNMTYPPSAIRRDVNHIRTLGDYSKPSHEGYENTIELPEGNNVAPLRSDTIQLVQNGCSFHGLQFEDPNQHLKDFL
ncbi:hypothetical protein Tco_1168001, partial [Tanacetum coccineum]